MFSRRTVPVLIGILFLSGMFLMGQDTWPPEVSDLLPDTGQGLCYNNTGEIDCPEPGEPFYGQDAQYDTGCSPSYTDNGDGTVTDNCTGLMWQQDDDDVLRNWELSLAYCENLIFADHSDWRLPNVRELRSILDYGQDEPTINLDYFADPGGADYSTSTTYLQNPALYRGVEFGAGLIHHYTKIHNSRARCVR